MPFLTYDNIKSDLPNDLTRSRAGRILTLIQEYLKTHYGLEFNGLTTRTQKFYIDKFESPKHIFNYSFFNNVTSLKIKNKDGSEIKELEQGADYTLYRAFYNLDFYRMIEIDKSQKYNLCYPYYLEVAGDFGDYDSTPEILTYAIIDYLEEYQKMENQGWQVINSSNIDGVSSISYNANLSQANKITKNPLESKEIMQAINIITR